MISKHEFNENIIVSLDKRQMLESVMQYADGSHMNARAIGACDTLLAYIIDPASSTLSSVRLECYLETMSDLCEETSSEFARLNAELNRGMIILETLGLGLKASFVKSTADAGGIKKYITDMKDVCWEPEHASVECALATGDIKDWCSFVEFKPGSKRTRSGKQW